MGQLLQRITNLDPIDFEYLTYDLLTLKGLRNISWRTPGADGGRDLEGAHLHVDLSGDTRLEKWFIECKRYSSAVDWPTVYEKLAYAENAGADCFLLCTTSTTSPACKNEIARWESRRSAPRFRAWEGPRLERLVAREPILLTKYNLSTDLNTEASTLPLLRLAAKSSHAAHGAAVLAGNCHPALELSAALLELATALLDTGFRDGASRRFLPERDLYLWATAAGSGLSNCGFDAYAVRALLAAARFMAGASQKVEVSIDKQAPQLLTITPFSQTQVGLEIASTVALLTNLEICTSNNGSLQLRNRDSSGTGTLRGNTEDLNGAQTLINQSNKSMPLPESHHETDRRPSSPSSIVATESLIPPLVLEPAFVLNFTHQIINPLNGIVGTVDNIIDGTIKEDRRPQRLKALRAQLSHIIELVRNLAFLSHLSTAQGREGLRGSAGPVNLPTVIIEAAQFFQEKGSGRGIEIELVDDRSQYAVPGQKDLLRQVFLNIFENATKYADRDTKVTVLTRPQKRTRELIVEVVNIGPGFAFADREKLFEPGFRGEIAKTTLASGSGLGLYICREILHLAHDAKIEAEHSNSKRQTTFRLRFPRYTLEVILGKEE